MPDEYERRKRVFTQRLTALVQDSWGLDPGKTVWDGTWGKLVSLFTGELAKNGLASSDLDIDRLAWRIEYVGDHLLDPDYASDIDWEVLKVLHDRRDELVTPYNE